MLHQGKLMLVALQFTPQFGNRSGNSIADSPDSRAIFTGVPIVAEVA
jgi:hypothetical protein